MSSPSVGLLVALGSGLVPLEGSVPFRQSLVYCPRGGLALAFYHCVPFWLDTCQAPRWSGLCLGLVGPHSAMALDLGWSLISSRCQLGVLVLRRSRIPRVGWRIPSKSRRLSLAKCTPFGVALARRKSGLAHCHASGS